MVLSLLSLHSKSLSSSASGLGSLSSDLDSPEVSETSMNSSFLHSLQILSELGVEGVRNELSPGSVLNVLLSVQEPLGNVVVDWSGEDVVDLLQLGFGKFSGSLGERNLGDLKNDSGESSSDTLDTS